MKNKELKSLLAKVAIIRNKRDNYEIFSTDDLLDLSIISDTDGCHFIEIGKEITLEGKKYKVTNIIFRLDSLHYGIGMYASVDLFSQKPEDANCQISVFVESVL